MNQSSDKRRTNVQCKLGDMLSKINSPTRKLVLMGWNDPRLTVSLSLNYSPIHLSSSSIRGHKSNQNCLSDPLGTKLGRNRLPFAQEKTTKLGLYWIYLCSKLFVILVYHLLAWFQSVFAPVIWKKESCQHFVNLSADKGYLWSWGNELIFTAAFAAVL